MNETPEAETSAAGTPEATIRTRVRVPLRFGDGYSVDAELVTFHGLVDGGEHLAIVLGEPGAVPGVPPLVRMHSECLTGDVFGSARCDCGPQLRESVERIAEVGGYLLYLRQEGRGIGLYNKLDAYALQDSGLDTYQANVALGLPEDARDYTVAAQMLTALGVDSVHLLSNNPDKEAQLAGLHVTVTERVPTGAHTTAHNLRYLRAKVEHTRHSIALDDVLSVA
jgi:GTP cyclohydrolase II